MKIKLNIFCLFLLSVWSTAPAAQPSLKEAYSSDFLVGCAVSDNQIQNKYPKETEIIIGQYNSISPGNLLKWGLVHPKPQQYNFAPADRYVEFGQKHNMFIVGHTLVWHNQIPQWVFQDNDGNSIDKDTLLARMKEHIFTVAGRYKGKVNGWDVVNEAITDDGKMRENNWFKIAGRDYVIKAFEYAQQADPNAELYYNDYSMWRKPRRDAVIELVKELRARGIRIDGVGMQGHWSLTHPPLEKAEESIIAFASLGLKVMITEVDVTVLPWPGEYRGADITKNEELRAELDPYHEGLPDEVQQQLAKRYADIFTLFHKHADKISRVTFWGVQDGKSWKNFWPVKGRTDYVLLFDRDCKPKPAFDAVIRVVKP
ncbi:MAG: endo-1,4-beta-xylanase [Sedimentisphaerales bacterium]|nr:endo-1,4-beta-xylanase [Sedimentisphaerales bacterium]